jgi:hypothetical protein
MFLQNFRRFEWNKDKAGFRVHNKGTMLRCCVGVQNAERQNVEIQIVNKKLYLHITNFPTLA